jgi:hypothetical protein
MKRKRTQRGKTLGEQTYIGIGREAKKTPEMERRIKRSEADIGQKH